MKRTLRHPRKTLLATLIASAFVVAAMTPPTAVAQTTTTTASTTGVPVITSPLVASGKVGVDFSYKVTATNSPTKYNFWLRRNGVLHHLELRRAFRQQDDWRGHWPSDTGTGPTCFTCKPPMRPERAALSRSR